MLTGILRVIQGLAEFEDFIQAARADEQEFVRMVDVLAIAADDIANAAAMLRRSQDEPPKSTFLFLTAHQRFCLATEKQARAPRCLNWLLRSRDPLGEATA